MESKIEKENENIKEKEINEQEELDKQIEKKLGDLLLRGWTMLAESCPLESCKVPLMRSPDGQKYCVNCEMWQFDNKKRKEKKFNELIPLKGKQDIQVKHMELTNPNKKKVIPNFDSIEIILNDKLNYLANRLSQESDLRNIEDIMKTMNLMMDTISHYKKISKFEKRESD